MNFFLLVICYTITKNIYSFVYLRIELVGIAKNSLIFLGANYGSTYSLSKYYNRNLIHSMDGLLKLTA